MHSDVCQCTGMSVNAQWCLSMHSDVWWHREYIIHSLSHTHMLHIPYSHHTHSQGLGVPFNIASYSLLTYMIAHICDLKVKFPHLYTHTHPSNRVLLVGCIHSHCHIHPTTTHTLTVTLLTITPAWRLCPHSGRRSRLPQPHWAPQGTGTSSKYLPV